MGKNALLDKAFNSVGGREQYNRKYNDYKRTLSFIEDNKEELLEQYKDNWIAAYHSNIIAHSKTPGKLIKELDKAGVPLDEIFIEFVTDKKEITLF